MAEDEREEPALEALSNSECESDAELMAEPPATRSDGGEARQLVSYSRKLTALFSQVCPPCLRPQTRQENGSTSPSPEDHFKLVYICMLMAGAGFLFPWVSYISAVDYFLLVYQDHFPHVPVIIPITYLVTTLISSTFNVAAVRWFPIHWRIGFGYVMFLIALLFVPLLNVGMDHGLSTHVSFYLTLLSVVLVGFGSGVQQSSYYGLSSMLPKRYSQALMAGESIAGVVVSINRIITKAAIKSEETSSIAFFVISFLFILVCVGCHCFIRTSPFVKHHTAKCSRTTAGREPETKEGVSREISLERLSTNEQDGEAMEQVGEDSEVLLPSAEHKPTRLQKFHGALQDRWRVVRQIWPLIVAIFTNYLITLLLFPGLLSEVVYCPVGDWAPIILIAVFNTTDFAAKWLTLIPFRWHPKTLMFFSCLRVVFIPLVVLCVSPSPSHPVISSSVLVWAALFAFFLGLSNGYTGSLPMINAAAEVKSKRDKELAGTIMTWFLLFGLSLGSVLAYALTPLTTLV